MTPSRIRLARCAGSIILAAILLAFTIGFVYGAGHLTRITTGGGSFPKLSADGTKVVFTSGSDFLGEGITGDHIWLYDTATMTFTRITTNETFRGYSLNAEGQKVTFNRGGEIWLYDTETLSVTRITTASHSDRGSSMPSINADGTKIAFVSDSDFLGQNIPNDQDEIWLYDTNAMTVTRITTASHSDRDSGDDRHGHGPGLSLSGDGTKIAFVSDSDFLGQNIPAGQVEIWLYNTNTMTVTRITTASDTAVDKVSFLPTLGYSGTKVAFISYSDFLDQGIQEDRPNVWIYNTNTMTYTRVTTPTNFRSSWDPSLSADETKLAFMSDYDLLGHGDVDLTEIWRYDLETQKLTRLTWGNGRSSEAPSINANGNVIAFHSDADFLDQGIPAYQYEIWLHRLAVYLPVVTK